jgi:hypothetical protein
MRVPSGHLNDKVLTGADADGAAQEGESLPTQQSESTSFVDTLRLLEQTTAAHSQARREGGAGQNRDQVEGSDAAMARRLLEAITTASRSGEGGVSQDGVDAFVQSMMTTLLCKDVLYEPMKVCHCHVRRSACCTCPCSVHGVCCTSPCSVHAVLHR